MMNLIIQCAVIAVGLGAVAVVGAVKLEDLLKKKTEQRKNERNRAKARDLDNWISILQIAEGSILLFVGTASAMWIGLLLTPIKGG